MAARVVAPAADCGRWATTVPGGPPDAASRGELLTFRGSNPDDQFRTWPWRLTPPGELAGAARDHLGSHRRAQPTTSVRRAPVEGGRAIDSLPRLGAASPRQLPPARSLGPLQVPGRPRLREDTRDSGRQPTPTRTGRAGETGCGRASFQLRVRKIPDHVHPIRGNLLLRKLTLIAALVVVLAMALAAFQLVRPLPRLELVAVGTSAVTVPGAAPALPWPTTGEADVAVAGIGTVGSSGGDQPEPVGSLAKIMTALLVLKAHPLGPGASGPILTITSQDVATYQADLAGGQSVVAVAAGEQVSELQLLQGLLLPSGNNIATLLANWDAGSQGSFVADMNQMAARLGLGHTHYADASGLSPATVSDAQDQARLAEVAMANRTFAGIVALPQVTLPVAGVAYNVNGLVTHDGIVGVKTGSTPQAGGCYVFAAERVIAGRPVTIIGSVLGQGGTSILTSALDAGEALINATSSALTDLIVVPSGGEVGRIASPWGGGVALPANRGIALVGWPGLAFHLRLEPIRLGRALRQGVKVGGLQVTVGATVVAQEELYSPGPITGPSLRWRLTRL